jgi:hypothetical protein
MLGKPGERGWSGADRALPSGGSAARRGSGKIVNTKSRSLGVQQAAGVASAPMPIACPRAQPAAKQMSAGSFDPYTP